LFVLLQDLTFLFVFSWRWS